MRHRQPNFFGDERHDRVHQTQRLIKHVAQDVLSIVLELFIGTIQIFLGHFDVPVTKIVPNEIVKSTSGFAKFKAVKQTRNFFDRLVQSTQNPFVGKLPFLNVRQIFCRLFIEVHDYETTRIPNLVDEIPCGIHLGV
jgi:hypothetical protein